MGDLTSLVEFIKVYGFPAVIVVLVLLAANKMLWKLVCSWVEQMQETVNNMKSIAIALDKSREEMNTAIELSNKRWQEVVDNINASIEKHTQDSKEAHFYTRAEHKTISDQQEIITCALKGVEAAIGRINGYTPEK